MNTEQAALINFLFLRGSVFQGIENASNRAESRMSVAGMQKNNHIVIFCFHCEGNDTIGSRRGSIASTHPEDVDLGWLAWKESRRNESRRWRISDLIFHQLSLLSISRNKIRRWKKSGLIIITFVIINLNR